MVGGWPALAVETARLADRRRLPEAAQLWWKGQLARRWEAEARAVAPLDRMQRIEVAAGIVAAAVLLATLLPRRSGPRPPAPARGELLPALAGLLSTSALAWVVVGVLGAVTASRVMLRRLLDLAVGAVRRTAAYTHCPANRPARLHSDTSVRQARRFRALLLRPPARLHSCPSAPV